LNPVHRAVDRPGKHVVSANSRIAGGPTAHGFEYYCDVDAPDFPPFCFIENDRTAGNPSMPKPPEIAGRLGPTVPGWTPEPIQSSLADRACAFVADRTAAKEPFFRHLALTSPHDPIEPNEALRGKSAIGRCGEFVMETGVVGAETGTGAELGTQLALTPIHRFPTSDGAAVFVASVKNRRHHCTARSGYSSVIP
jgi:hypothetical protein